MRKIIGAAFVSLDGVMQAPGGTTEDPTGGFKYSGWLPPVGDGDEAIGKTIGELFNGSFDLLLGRRTYDIFAAFWPYVEGNEKPMGEIFDRVRKYVVTRGDKHRSYCPGQAWRWTRSDYPGQQYALSAVARGRPDRSIDPDDVPGRTWQREAAVRRAYSRLRAAHGRPHGVGARQYSCHL